MPNHFTDLRLSNSKISYSNQNRIAKDKWLLALASSILDLTEKDRICTKMNMTTQNERRLSKNESSP